jgi:hypothetical protein
LSAIVKQESPLFQSGATPGRLRGGGRRGDNGTQVGDDDAATMIPARGIDEYRDRDPPQTCMFMMSV